MHLHCYDRHRLPKAVRKELNLGWPLPVDPQVLKV
jgi:hypothetical protein